jgi:hypothetical protein
LLYVWLMLLNERLLMRSEVKASLVDVQVARSFTPKLRAATNDRPTRDCRLALYNVAQWTVCVTSLLSCYALASPDINADIITRWFRAERAGFCREKEMFIFSASMVHHFSEHASQGVSRESEAYLSIFWRSCHGFWRTFPASVPIAFVQIHDTRLDSCTFVEGVLRYILTRAHCG